MDSSERFFQNGLKLAHLRLLTLFAELGQVRLVAARLNVSQPAVSKQLADLEHGLGAPVLTRVGNRLQFTVLGEALLKRAREILHQLEQARHEADALCSGISGHIAIGAVATVLPVVGPDLVIEIKKVAPNVAVSLSEATSDKLFPMLAAGALDLVFSRTPPAEASTLELAGQTLLEDPVVIVCGRQHPLAARRSIAAADLAGIAWILPPRAAPTYAALSRWMHQHGLAFPEGCVQSISLTTNETLLARYPFLALMPLALAQRRALDAGLTILRLPGARFLGPVWVFHNKATANPVIAPVLECVRTLQARFATGQDSAAAPAA